MRDLYLLNNYRLTGEHILKMYGTVGDGTCGAFVVPSPIDRRPLRVVAASGDGWDHVSVSRENRCPNWPEMAEVRRLFFLPDEVCMQLHPKADDHINDHPYTLHLWRPTDKEIPMPPKEMV
jgi:hypothetical protein